MQITKVPLDKGNRMIRFGKNNNNWFARIDLWYIGLRITRAQ